MPRYPKHLAPAQARFLDHVTRDLANPCGDGESSRTYSIGEPWQPLYVERIGENRYSLAYYVDQNGERCADPYLEFVKVEGKWYPAACQLLIGRYSVAIETDAAGAMTIFRERTYADLRSFAIMFLRNAKVQQAIKLPRLAA